MLIKPMKMKGRSNDNPRFLVPLRFLNHPIFRVVLEMAEEEYGLTAHGPLRLPCEKEFLHFILSLLRNNTDDDVHLDNALLSLRPTSLRPSMQTPVLWKALLRWELGCN